MDGLCRCCAGTATSFSPGSIVANMSTASLVAAGAASTSSVQVSGQFGTAPAMGAEPTEVVFEPNSTCSGTGMAVGAVAAGSVVVAGGRATATVGLGSGGLSGGLWSVCVRFSSSGTFFKVSSAQLIVRCVSSFFC